MTAMEDDLASADRPLKVVLTLIVAGDIREIVHLNGDVVAVRQFGQRPPGHKLVSNTRTRLLVYSLVRLLLELLDVLACT